MVLCDKELANYDTSCKEPKNKQICFEDFTVGSRVQMGSSKYIVYQNDSRGLILKPE